MAHITPKILFTIWPFIKSLPTFNINDILNYFFPITKNIYLLKYSTQKERFGFEENTVYHLKARYPWENPSLSSFLYPW